MAVQRPTSLSFLPPATLSAPDLDSQILPMKPLPTIAETTTAVETIQLSSPPPPSISILINSEHSARNPPHSTLELDDEQTTTFTSASSSISDLVTTTGGGSTSTRNPTSNSNSNSNSNHFSVSFGLAQNLGPNAGNSNTNQQQQQQEFNESDCLYNCKTGMALTVIVGILFLCSFLYYDHAHQPEYAQTSLYLAILCGVIFVGCLVCQASRWIYAAICS